MIEKEKRDTHQPFKHMCAQLVGVKSLPLNLLRTVKIINIDTKQKQNTEAKNQST